MKTYKEFKTETQKILTESEQFDILMEFCNGDINNLTEEKLHELSIGGTLGFLGGSLFGERITRLICKALGIQEGGFLYNFFTSKIVTGMLGKLAVEQKLAK